MPRVGRQEEKERERERERIKKRNIERDIYREMKMLSCFTERNRQTETNQALDKFINILQLKVLSVNEFVCLFVL